MSVVAAPVFVPRKYWRLCFVLMLALFLGLLSAADVGQVALNRINCEPIYITADDGKTILTADDGVRRLTAGRQCHGELPGLRLPLPGWLPL